MSLVRNLGLHNRWEVDSPYLAKTDRQGFEPGELRTVDVGELEGHSAPEDWQQFVELNRAWINKQWDLKLPGGESFYEVRDRFVPFVNNLINKYQDSGENILLVSHGGIFVHMLPLVMDNLTAAFAAEHYLRPTEYAIGLYTAGIRTCIYWGNKELSLP